MKTIITLILVLSSALVFAGEVEKNLGFAAGAVSGIGLSYRQFYEKAGFQITGAAYVDGTKESEEYQRQFNGGLQGFYTLSKPSDVRFYLLGGVSFFYNENRFSEEVYTMEGEYAGDKIDAELDRSYNIGTGIGMQVTFLKHANIAIEWPLFYNTDGSFTMYIPQIGIYYKF
ncbi:MAG: hypothetical protein JXR56_06090 [Candidatus Cloacimonetes bacterium]|nr:hypothetical protein [Candidatus Cloacimonadota bacterium]